MKIVLLKDFMKRVPLIHTQQITLNNNRDNMVQAHLGKQDNFGHTISWYDQ